MPCRSAAPRGLSTPRLSGAHHGSVSDSTAACNGRGEAEGGAPRESVALGVRLCDLELEYVIVTERVVEGLGRVEAEAEVVLRALMLEEAEALPVGDWEGVRVPPGVREGKVEEEWVAEVEVDPVDIEDSVGWGLVPTVAVEVCDAEEERVLEAEPEAEGVDEADPVACPVAEPQADTEALPLTRGVRVRSPVPLVVAELQSVAVEVTVLEEREVNVEKAEAEKVPMKPLELGCAVTLEDPVTELVSVEVAVSDTVAVGRMVREGEGVEVGSWDLRREADTVTLKEGETRGVGVKKRWGWGGQWAGQRWFERRTGLWRGCLSR